MSYKMRPCPICGELMKAWSNRRTCSHKCRQKAWRLKNRNEAMKITSATVGRLAIRCRNCGEKIPNPRLDQQYCGKACKQAMYRQRCKFHNDDTNVQQLQFPESAYTVVNQVNGVPL